MSTNPMILRHRAGAYRSPCGQVLRVLNEEGKPVFLVRRAPRDGKGEEGIEFVVDEGKPVSVHAPGVQCWGAAEPCCRVHAEDPWKHLGRVEAFETTEIFASGKPFVECIVYDETVFVREGYVDGKEQPPDGAVVLGISGMKPCRTRAKEGNGNRWWRTPAAGRDNGSRPRPDDEDMIGPAQYLGPTILDVQAFLGVKLDRSKSWEEVEPAD